jgi:hypothetical protein
MSMVLDDSSGLQGDAVYAIYDGTERDKHHMELLLSHMHRRTRKQLFLLSAREEEGQKIIRHFHLSGTHFVLIINKNLGLHHMWTDGDQLDAPHIASMAEQAH